MNIQIKNLTKEIKGRKVLTDISIAMQDGNIYGFKGPNGCGKTMLMRCICGFIMPTHGEVKLDGKVIGKDISFPQSIGALIENPSFLNGYTAYANLKFLADLQGGLTEAEIKSTVSEVGLDPEDKRKYKSFSLGMKARLGIAAAILGTPELVILDEPTNALDENAIQLVKKIIIRLKDAGCLVIISNHDTTVLEALSDTVFLMSEGKVVKTYHPNRKRKVEQRGQNEEQQES